MSAQIRLELRQIKERALDKVFQRGQALYTNRAISAPGRRGDEINARCRGSYPQPYRVWAKFRAEEIAGTGCSCEYDWGGDCKHIIALLLTYLYEPERFEERETLRDALMSREKEDLLDIIEEMIVLHPELEDIVELVAGDGASNHLTDPQAIRRELSPSLAFSGEWMDQVAENKVYEVTRRGSRLALRGDYARAIAVYCAILDECNAHEYPTDDEGQYVDAVNNTVAHLKDAISRFDFADDEDLRLQVLDTLVDTLIWDIEFGGIDYGFEAEKLILSLAQPTDIPRIRQHVGLIADREETDESSSNWKQEAYESFLMELDKLEATDPEVTLKRLQAKKLHYLYASKLLDLKRYEEAAEIISAKLQSADQLRRGLDLLLERQQIQTAIRLAEESLEWGYDRRIASWLIDLHRRQGDQTSELRWQLQRMRQEPHINFYESLSAVSKSLDLWQKVRPQVISDLTREKSYKTLTLVYLHDEDWDMAWETLEKASAQQDRHPSALHYRLDFAVAEASRQAKPARALPIYIKYARAEIAGGNRKRYAAAAKLLGEVRKIYAQINDTAGWQRLIADLRAEFARRPALQDELDQAGL
ncbi:MAG: hypothetical protein OXT68_00455 [Chloroflexota bacterium]|nr:hypothetical protein [Chloroflexota bacterium]